MPTEDNRFIFPMAPEAVPAKIQQPLSGSVAAQFLYKNGDNYVFMDAGTYELIEFKKDSLGQLSGFLKEGQEGITITFAAGFVLGLELPAIVELKVMELTTQIDSRSGDATAVAALETGAELTVPLTVQEGQIIRVDTKTGTFAGMV